MPTNVILSNGALQPSSAVSKVELQIILLQDRPLILYDLYRICAAPAGKKVKPLDPRSIQELKRRELMQEDGKVDATTRDIAECSIRGVEYSIWVIDPTTVEDPRTQVTLTNGEKEHLTTVQMIFKNLDEVAHVHRVQLALTHLQKLCKNPKHKITIPWVVEMLQANNLLEKDGTVSDSVRRVALCAIQGSGCKLVNPIKTIDEKTFSRL